MPQLLRRSVARLTAGIDKKERMVRGKGVEWHPQAI